MSDFDLALGCLITAHRKHRKLTQVALAKHTGSSQARVSRIEAGASPTVAEFARLAPALHKGGATALYKQAQRVVDIAHKIVRMIFFPEARVPIRAVDIIPIIASRMPEK